MNKLSSFTPIPTLFYTIHYYIILLFDTFVLLLYSLFILFIISLHCYYTITINYTHTRKNRYLIIIHN